MKKGLLRGCIPLLLSALNSNSAVLPDLWVVRDSPTANQLNAVTFGNGLFVAVGTQATILTSSNGRDWIIRSGMASPAFFATAFGGGRYVGGGSQGGLVRYSTDGINWSNALSTIGSETIHGITWGYNEFVAVGRGAAINSSYILVSSNGVDWFTRTAPTTNTLYAVSPAYALGVGWADLLYVAVGDHGTIVTSTNGIDWVLRNSATSVTLRSVVWHGGFVVAGDSGTVLRSSDGVTWNAVAPASFDVRGLTTSGLNGVVVAAGDYKGQGRLHASATGTTWPGTALQFPGTLNGIAFGGGSFVAVGNGGLIVQGIVSSGATNEWTKSTSGYWEEPYWSLGILPAPDQSLISFKNAGFKALAIGSNTTANFSNSLVVQNLLVDAPTNSFNQLLLNWAGLNVPLLVQSNLTIGVNGSLASHYSLVQAVNFLVSSDATFSDAAIATFDRTLLGLDAEGHLNLIDGSIESRELNVGYRAAGIVNQTGGILQSTALHVPFTNVAQGDYFLSGGSLLSGGLTLGRVDLNVSGPGRFQHEGGVHSNSEMTLWGELRPPGVAIPFGFYTLNAGVLASEATTVYGGRFVQNGGSNYMINLNLQFGGTFFLNGGLLVTSNAILDVSGSVDEFIVQLGGVHRVQKRLRLDGAFVRYQLSGGTLLAPDIDVGMNAQLRLFGGAISNQNVVAIEGGGSIQAGVLSNIQLGKLQITNTPFSRATLDMNPSGPGVNIGPTVIRFRDSREVPWSGALNIVRWTPSQNEFGAGPDHIFVGTNFQGLTAAQLNQIQFVDPGGWPAGNYAATLLASGELVPATAPPLDFIRTNDALVLSWSGPYELTTATNVSGPYMILTGVTSPATNAFTDPHRFFRLRTPSP